MLTGVNIWEHEAAAIFFESIGVALAPGDVGIRELMGFTLLSCFLLGEILVGLRLLFGLGCETYLRYRDRSSFIHYNLFLVNV